MNIFVKIFLKILILPIFIIICFFKYVIKWFGTIGIIILKLISGLSLVSGTIIIFYLWKDGNLTKDFSYIWIFIMGFVFSALAMVIAFVPATLEILTEKMLAFILG